MPFLDVTPMMVALRTRPEEFELNSGWLKHLRSDHHFRFAPQEPVQIRAACNCAFLAVRPDQELELAACFREWQSNYWHPLQVNREFASHFSEPSWTMRVLIRLSGNLHRWLLRRGREHDTADAKPIGSEA